MLDSAIKTSHPQTFLEECKYEIKNTKMENLIFFINISDNEANSESDNETDNESDNSQSSD